MKKIISVILILSFVLFIFASCKSEEDTNEPDDIIPSGELSDILEKYKTNGLTSWWEVVAVYNAGENPVEYKGFEDLYLSLEGTANLKMASYVIVANIAIVKGMDKNKFDKYEEYKTSLKNLLENPTDKNTLNDYIFGYLALKCSGVNFDESKVLLYFIDVQKDDGGFVLSGDSGDVDMTAFTVIALKLLENFFFYDYFDISVLENAVNFLESNINENGTFTSYGSQNANSTACALSALVQYYSVYGEYQEILLKASDALALFVAKKDVGYFYSEKNNTDKADSLATAQVAIALGDLTNGTSVWEKLYYEYKGKFGD